MKDCREGWYGVEAKVAALSDEERKILLPTVDITCHMWGKTHSVKM